MIISDTTPKKIFGVVDEGKMLPFPESTGDLSLPKSENVSFVLKTNMTNIKSSMNYPY